MSIKSLLNRLVCSEFGSESLLDVEDCLDRELLFGETIGEECEMVFATGFLFGGELTSSAAFLFFSGVWYVSIS